MLLHTCKHQMRIAHCVTQLNNVLTRLGVAAEVTVDEHLSALISLYGKLSCSFELNTISVFFLALQKNDKLIYLKKLGINNL